MVTSDNSKIRDSSTLICCVLVTLLLDTLVLPRTPKRPWMNESLSPDERASLLVNQMTLDEKIQLVHGSMAFGLPGFPRPVGALGGDGFVPGIPRLGIPPLQLIGAGVGVTNLGHRPNGQATALPSSLAETATWDPKVAYEFGRVIGRETRDQGFNVSLGGGIDLARDPRNGRNFEYHGEDPILAGTITAQELRAIQDQGVIATIKHYALNDQESGRTMVSSDISRRAMRESDLLAFEIGIKDSGVGAVMCSYNRVNGVYSCQNSYLLNDVLKLNWGFKGWVMSDWGATHSTVDSALSGLDQEFFANRYFSAPLKRAVEQGDAPLSVLNDKVHRILRTMFAVGEFDKPPVVEPIDFKADASVAERVEEQGAVLLKNSHNRLPLDLARVRSIAIIGAHADVGVLSGGGSAQVDPVGGNAVAPGARENREWFEPQVWDPSSPLRAIRAIVPHTTVDYDSGSDLGSAARLAARSDVAIVFASQWTHEGGDLPNLSLPANQNSLISRIAAANPQTVVVLETGDPVLMPWLGKVDAVLEAWYPGQRGGEAIARILFGIVDPSGKLPITFPKSESQLPRPQLQGPPPGGGYFDVDYWEGLRVGYKWYDAEGVQPLFPFGFGLSYTTFSFSNLQIAPSRTNGSSRIRVSFDVRNTGSRAGAEVAEVYLGLPPSADEPSKRLVGWAKANVPAGQTRKVTVMLDPKSASHPFSFWNTDKNGWDMANGEYRVYVGSASRDLPLTAAVQVVK
jgi:beta-glucosidase